MYISKNNAGFKF